MNTSFKKKLSKHKRIIISAFLIILGIGLTFLVMNVFAGTPPSSCPPGTLEASSHCESCLELTASPTNISAGNSSTLTLEVESKQNGIPNPSWTMNCSIDHGVLPNTTLNNGIYSYPPVWPISTTIYTASCTGVGQDPPTTVGSVTVTVVDTTDPTISFNPISRSWATTNVDVIVTASDASGISATYYCWTEGVSCAPDTSFTNGSTLTQSDDGNWKLCIKARDNFNNEKIDCSSPYQIDKTIPIVDSFSVHGHTSDFSIYDTSLTDDSLTIAWSVSDSGGSNLSNVEVWRQTDGGSWSKIYTEAISGSSDSGFWEDEVTCGHSYKYGIHVFDFAGNKGIEGSPITATVQCNQEPTAIDLKATKGNYCFTPLYIYLSWQFFDLNVGDTQDYYRIQIDDNSDFSSPEKDSGKVSTIGLPGPNYSYSPSLSSYNETYYWRLMVWDDKEAASDWIYPSGFSFDTPSHKYPEPKFVPSLQNPSVDQVVEFIDSSKCYDVGSEGLCRDGGVDVSYEWDFDYDVGEGFTLDSTHKGNATTTYPTSESYTIRLRVTDDLATCSTDQTVNVTFPLPEWEEGTP